MSQICVIGLGYVGLTLATAFAKRGHTVFGVERSQGMVDKILSTKPPFLDEGLQESLHETIGKGLLKIASSLENIEVKFDFIVIAIGTPISEESKIDMSNFESMPEQLRNNLSASSVLILRSTIPIGTSRTLKAIFDSGEINIGVAYCPERTVEGVALKELYTLPQVVSADNPEILSKVIQLFSTITDDVVPVSTLETAELVKLASNMWRDYTFAFSNEMFKFARTFEVDIIEMINASNYKYSRNQIPSPGGVGGPCLTKDTYIFNQSIGTSDNLFSEARKINSRFPSMVIESLGERGLIKGSVGILGWTFKGTPATTDIRFSPTLDFLEEINKISWVNQIYGWDAEEIEIVQLPASVVFLNRLDELLSKCDSLVIANNHAFFGSTAFVKLIEETKNSLTIFDLWNMIPKIQSQNHQIYTLGEI